VGIVKAYCTRVGEGPFPTEAHGDDGKKLLEVIVHNLLKSFSLCPMFFYWMFDDKQLGKEYGTTTGRPRRCGWIDITQLHYSQMINNFTFLGLTKMDILSHFKEIKIGVVCTHTHTHTHTHTTHNTFTHSLTCLCHHSLLSFSFWFFVCIYAEIQVQ
jgi:adenylosuccinate synthase